MELQKAKELVVLAGRQLVEAGLIARTWGNVSCRVSATRFVITPSGRAYETLTPEEVVAVNLEDGSYEGEIKPSSEKGIHAEAYKHRPEVNFIIHTHQLNASMVSPLGLDVPVRDPAAAQIIGERVPCARYGLPGTGKLKKAVAEALEQWKNSRAILMAYHGALCLGRDYDEAFRVASELEKVCRDFVLHRYREISGGEEVGEDQLRDYFVAKASGKAVAGFPHFLYNSEREGDSFKLYIKASEEEPFPGGEGDFIRCRLLEPGPGEEERFPEAEIHRRIYRRYKDIRAIRHGLAPDIVAVSRTGRELRPLLDDFAQLIGVSVRVAQNGGNPGSAEEIARKLKGRYAVLLRGNGALCCGPSRGDATAALMVMEKGCKALIGTSLFGRVRPINFLESALMRFVYLTQYSKKAAAK
ncbi:MAG TPA: class II aldolase/adducin family protein [Bacillota bacterium]|jgi:L-fuculose-phosphate aldolase|nr:class II aldolase/adducin family protein [Bacillota bacterium]